MTTSRGAGPEAPPAPPARDLRAIRDAFIAYEEGHDLWTLSAYGRPYWHFLRHEVFGDLLRAMGLMGRRHGGFSDKPWRERLAIHPRRWPATIRRSHWLDLPEVDVLCMPHNRYVERDGAWLCPYTTPLLASLAHRHLSVKDLYEGRHPHPIPDPDLRYLEWQRRFAELGFLFRHAWRGANLRRSDRDEVAAWVDGISRAFDTALPLGPVLAQVRRAVRNQLTLERVYRRLLDRTRPRLVVLAVHYTHRNLCLTPLARERGIPVVEIQHGFIGAEHIAYNLAPGRRPRTFPDYLFTFGDFWRDTTPGLPLDEAHAPPIGFAWLEQQRARAVPDAPDPRRTVLFVSQGTVARGMAEAAVALSERLDPARWRVRFKHHPSDFSGWRERYPGLAAARVDVIDRPIGIYDAFAAADAQVGVYSTAVYEGLSFGLDTCILKVPGWESMRPLIASGAVTLCEDADAIAIALESVGGRAPDESSEGVVKNRALWYPGSVDRFRSLVEHLIGPPPGE